MHIRKSLTDHNLGAISSTVGLESTSLVGQPSLEWQLLTHVELTAFNKGIGPQNYFFDERLRRPDRTPQLVSSRSPRQQPKSSWWFGVLGTQVRNERLEE